MEKMALFSVLFVLACLHVDSVRSALGSTEVNCVSGSNVNLGNTEEGYEGVIEIITNISPDVRLVLEPHISSIAMKFLELVYSDGDSIAIVRTIKPLDAEEIKMSADALYYSVTCYRGPKNVRTLYILDVNDNPPIFQSKSYSATVSETTAVGTDLLNVRAIDADAFTENKRITYSILPPDEFEVSYDAQMNACDIKLAKPLNYNNVQQYNFIVEAKDIGGLRDTTTVTITVEGSPYFDHSLYKASIEENKVGHVSDVTPEAIKAQDDKKGINKPVVFSITTVVPKKYQNSFEIDQNSGVISVTTPLDREETEQIAVFIQATQKDDASKTADAVVLITIVNVNDNLLKVDLA
ncbi:cadherin-11-like [Garra rufa]|uniref:cadherin-11-like n=1 Tax=Garra rufa TaxID=137080 RepID=UPI003CCED7E0